MALNVDMLDELPARRGHFLLESGYHSSLWLTLDAIFVNPRTIAPLVEALAAKLRPHEVSAVCGPLLGGAFLAQSVAAALDTDFYFTWAVPDGSGARLFGAEYRLPMEFQRRVAGQRVAVVDDVISAGSSARATVSALAAAGASVAAIGSLLALGTVALDHFAALGLPVEALGRRDFTAWKPSACPLCAAGVPLENMIDS